MIESFLFMLLAGVGAMFIGVMGLLSAFWPINDKVTSLTHKVFTLAITGLLVYAWMSVFKY